MRNISSAGPSDYRANPRERCEYHVTHRPNHEDLKCAVPIAQLVVNHAKNTVHDAKDKPGDHARSQKVPRPAKKSKNGDGCKKNKNPGAGNVALEGEALENWDLIGDKQPGGKNQAEANSGIDAGANGCIGKEIQAARTGQICSNEHSQRGSHRAN